MNILISNDDGIDAEGIAKLAEALSKAGDVYVFAPDTQRSASSHALSINKDIIVKPVDFPAARMAFSVAGTPADCVKLGVDILKRKGINTDIVYSGINHGGNLGTDTKYSGTVSSAAEGMLLGIPAVAVSVNDHNPQYFEAACRLAVNVLDKALGTAGKGSVVNINTPNIPLEQIKGARAAVLGPVEYDEWFYVAEETPEQIVYRYSGKPIEVDTWTEDMDVSLIRKGYCTVSMIKYDLNDYEGLEELKEWEIKI